MAQRGLRLLGTLALGWIVLVPVVLLQLAPWWPRSARGWALLVLVGPPVYLAASWLLERWKPLDRAVRLTGARSSGARIAVGVAVTLAVLLPFWWVLARLDAGGRVAW
jgi:hypothetical protein